MKINHILSRIFDPIHNQLQRLTDGLDNYVKSFYIDFTMHIPPHLNVRLLF